MLSVREAAVLLGVNGQRVRQLLGTGRIEGARTTSGAWLIDPDSAQRWAAGRRTGRPARSAPSPPASLPDVPASTMANLCRRLGRSSRFIRELVEHGVIAPPVRQGQRSGYSPEAPAQLAAAVRSGREGGDGLRHAVLWEAGVALPEAGYQSWLGDRVADLIAIADDMEHVRVELAAAAGPLDPTEPHDPDDPNPEATRRGAMRAAIADQLAEEAAERTRQHLPTLLAGSAEQHGDALTDAADRALDIDGPGWSKPVDAVEGGPSWLDQLSAATKAKRRLGFTPTGADAGLMPASFTDSLRRAAAILPRLPQWAVLQSRPFIGAVGLSDLTDPWPLSLQRAMTAVMLAALIPAPEAIASH